MSTAAPTAADTLILLNHRCSRCGRKASPTYNGQLYLRGWLCAAGQHWDPAIGRERKFRKPVEQAA